MKLLNVSETRCGRGSPTIGGYGDQPQGNFSELNPYFMQSEAFCDCFHDIIKAYSASEINFFVFQP